MVEYKIIAENSYDLILILNNKFEVDYFNKKPLYKILGYKKEHVERRDVKKLIHPEDFERVIKALNESFKKAQTSVTARVRSIKGEYKYLEAKGGTFFDENGDKKLIINIRDISDKINREKELKYSQELFRKVATNANDAIIIIDLEARIKFWNAAAEKIFLYSKEDAIGNYLYETIMPERYRHNFLTAIERFIKLGENSIINNVMEVEARRKDGKEIDVEISHSELKVSGDWHGMAIVRDVTERKDTERKLKASKDRFRTLIQAAPDIIFTINREYQMLFINRILLEYQSNNPIGKNFLDYLDSKYQEPVKKKFDKVFKIGKSAYIEAQFHENKDTVSKYSAHLAPIKKDGEVKEIIVIARNITKKKLYNEQAFKKRLEFEHCVSKISSRFIEFDDIDVVINQSLKDIGKLSGADRSYLFAFTEDQEFMKNTHEWCKKGVEPQIQILQDIPSASLPWWTKKLKNGEILHVKDVSILPEEARAVRELLKIQNIKSLLVFPIINEQGLKAFVGFDNVRTTGEWDEFNFELLNTISEIIGNALERERIRNNLKISERKYRHLFDSVPYAIYLIDLDGVLLDINAYTEKLFGYERKNLVGKNIFSLELPLNITSEQMLSFFNTLLDKGSIRQLEYKFVKNSGEKIWISVHASIISIDEKKLIQAIIYDITDRKLSEENLKKLNNLKSELFKRVSHQLKTPLNSILGYANLLLMKSANTLTGEELSFLSEIIEGGKRINKNIDEIFELTKITSPHEDLNLKKEDIIPIIKKVVKNLRSKLLIKNQILEMNIPETIFLYFDRERIFDVVTNMIENAINYTPPNGNIKVSGWIDRNNFIFSVKDNGIGIDERDRSALFKEFGRIKRPDFPDGIKKQGTGLGLFICKNIITKHQGKIWVESEGINKGSTFSFSIPIGDD